MNTTYAAECAEKRAGLDELRRQGVAKNAPYLPCSPKVKLDPLAAAFVANRTFFFTLLPLLIVAWIVSQIIGHDGDVIGVAVLISVVRACTHWVKLIRGS